MTERVALRLQTARRPTWSEGRYLNLKADFTCTEDDYEKEVSPIYLSGVDELFSIREPIIGQILRPWRLYRVYDYEDERLYILRVWPAKSKEEPKITVHRPVLRIAAVTRPMQ